MKQYRIAVLAGDGIGPEITKEAVRALAAALGDRLSFQTVDAGAGLFLKTGAAMPAEAFEACREADAMLMGAIGLPEARHPDGTEVSGDVMFRLRFGLDLYAGIRPVRLYPGVPCPLRRTGAGIDYVVVRENVEGLYASRGGGCSVQDQVTVDSLIVTRRGTERIVERAFALAASRSGRPSDGKRVVTCVDKANVLRSYAFFRGVFDEVAARHPDIATDHVYVDAMTTYQVLRPWDLDVLVAENMFGDIISDLSGATVGGLGMAPSADVGDAHGLFQPAHGSSPDIAGTGRANPTAAVLSAAMMLDWLADRRGDEEARQAADRIRGAVEGVLAAGALLTPDLGGSATTEEMGTAFAKAVSG
jgi:3-isopropylmalate dehydrogenase